jgi:hypothetical protein
MPYFKRRGASQEVAIDTAPVIIGVDSANPPNLVAAQRASYMLNRLATVDAINRVRPGITRKLNIGNTQPILSAAYYTAGQYLITDGQNLWGYVSATNTLTLLKSTLPFTTGVTAPPLYMQPGGTGNAGNIMVMNQGGGIFHWDGTNFNAASMPLQSPTMGVPIWGSNRLITAETGVNNAAPTPQPSANNVILADIGTVPFNWGPLNNSSSVTVTLDQEGSDSVIGLALYQLLNVIAFKRGKIYVIGINPSATVADFPLQNISTVIGCCNHKTIQQVGNDVYFLSESGNGVYSINTLQGTSNLGISTKISARIQPDINNINFSAIGVAFAITWQDLYLLFVPINGSTQVNAVYVWSPVLQEWQGIWNFATPSGAADTIIAAAYNPSAATGSELLYVMGNGDIALHTRPLDAQYWDIAVGGTMFQIISQILTRGFHWDGVLIPPSQAEEPYNIPPDPSFINQVEPYNMRFRFNDSTAPVQLDILTDLQTTLSFNPSLSTTTKKLQLPHNLPWNLDYEGDAYQPVNIQGPAGVCNEVQAQLTGTGDWRLQKIDATAFVSRPLDNL